MKDNVCHEVRDTNAVGARLLIEYVKDVEYKSLESIICVYADYLK